MIQSRFKKDGYCCTLVEIGKFADLRISEYQETEVCFGQVSRL